MITLNLPETKPQTIEIRSEDRVTKGLLKKEEDRLPAVAALSNPIAQLVTPKMVKDDPELVEFIKSNAAEFKFCLLHATCTFYPLEDEPFEQAWLNVTLSCADGREVQKPTVWSMRPEWQATELQISSETSLGSKLKFQDIGFDASNKVVTSWKKELTFLQGYLIDSDPFWEFNATKTAEIRGNYKLSMIIRVPASISGISTLALRAVIKRKKLGLIPYMSDFPTAPEFSVKLE